MYFKKKGLFLLFKVFKGFLKSINVGSHLFVVSFLSFFTASTLVEVNRLTTEHIYVIIVMFQAFVSLITLLFNVIVV